MLTISLGSVGVELATVNDHATNITNTLQELSNLHMKPLRDVQSIISAHAAKQCYRVAQISQKGVLASQKNDEHPYQHH